MKDKLKAEGITDVEYLAITGPGFTWKDHVEGYDKVDLPVMSDFYGTVFKLWSATFYDAFLVDKKGRLVLKQTSFSNDHFDFFNKRIRELHAE